MRNDYNKLDADVQRALKFLDGAKNDNECGEYWKREFASAAKIIRQLAGKESVKIEVIPRAVSQPYSRDINEDQVVSNDKPTSLLKRIKSFFA